MNATPAARARDRTAPISGAAPTRTRRNRDGSTKAGPGEFDPSRRAGGARRSDNGGDVARDGLTIVAGVTAVSVHQLCRPQSGERSTQVVGRRRGVEGKDGAARFPKPADLS